jgi:glycosyltransferase involved in cell wall biosynthesis
MAVKVRIIGRDSHFIFVSKSVQKSWSNSFRFRGKYTITPNLLAMEVTRRKNKNIPLEFTTIGNASKLKNVESILQVWVDILAAFPGAHLNLIGPDLHDRSKLYEKWSQFVGKSVTWHGYISQTSVETILDGSSFYIHFSLEESQGLSVAEAMSRGCVCILNKSVPALYETTGGAAFFVNPSEKEEIIKIVRILIADKHYRESSANEAIASVKKNFDKNLTLLPILKVYEEKR